MSLWASIQPETLLGDFVHKLRWERSYAHPACSSLALYCMREGNYCTESPTLITEILQGTELLDWWLTLVQAHPC